MDTGRVATSVFAFALHPTLVGFGLALPVRIVPAVILETVAVKNAQAVHALRAAVTVPAMTGPVVMANAFASADGVMLPARTASRDSLEQTVIVHVGLVEVTDIVWTVLEVLGSVFVILAMPSTPNTFVTSALQIDTDQVASCAV